MSVRFPVAAATIALLAGMHGLANALVVDPHTTPDSPGYTEAARAILDGGYDVPIGVPGEFGLDVTRLKLPPDVLATPAPYTVRAPGYPLLLAAAGGGGDGVSRWVVIVLQAVLFSAATWLLILTARRVWSPRVALAAGTLLALDPFTKRYVGVLLTECLAMLLVAAALYPLVRAFPSQRIGWWTATGAAVGTAALVRPSLALLAPLAAVVALTCPFSARSRVAAAAAVAGAVLVVIAPWAVRNWTLTGEPVLAGFGSGWGLLLAAHGEGSARPLAEVDADPAFLRDFTSVHRFAPSPGELRREPSKYPRYLLRADNVQRRLGWDLYRERLSDTPAAVAGEYLSRVAFLWTADDDWLQPPALDALTPLEWALLALVAAGVALSIVAGGAARTLALIVLAFTLTSAAVHVETRYSYPFRGLYFAFAVVPLDALVRRIVSRRSAR